jgi:FkbM family methyltransferase
MFERISTLLSNLIYVNRKWLGQSKLSIGTRLAYYGSLTVAFTRYLLTGRKQVRFLGRSFLYDNRMSPLILMSYPGEIQDRILDNLAHPVSKVLDIGGNIGQFTVTLRALLPSIESIDVIEPNGDIFPLLEHNLPDDVSVRCFNVGIGPDGTETLYFTPGASSIGSIIPENARHRESSNLQPLEIRFVSSIPLLTGNGDYDLVKIDVEGFEYDVVEALEGVKMRYLYIEMTGPAKAKTRHSSDLLLLIERKFGPFDVRYQSQGFRSSTTFETLLEFV